MSAQRHAARDARHLDALLGALADAARVLPAVTPLNGAEERARLEAEVARGAMAVPKWELPARRPVREAKAWLANARALAEGSPARALYLAKLDELDLDLALLDALGDPRRVRPLAARRFGTGKLRVDAGDGDVALADAARAILRAVPPSEPEPRTLPADSKDAPSAASIVREVALRAGLVVDVRVEARLAANAAAGERLVCLADRRFGEREAWRLAVHEVLGHLVAAANGRTQPLALLAVGTAGSFGDQEGLATGLEELAGVLDASRLRTLAARVVATDAMHAHRPFGDVARELVRDHAFAPRDAVTIAERAYRGGGVARDAAYLHGFLRVRRALRDGATDVDELRLGKVGLDDLPLLRALRAQGLVRPAAFRPPLPRTPLAPVELALG